MPELPDVEMYKKYVDERVLDQRIVGTHIFEPRLVKVPPQKLERALKNHKLEETRRHGKWLFVHADAGPWLVLHFGMTGDLKYYEDEADAPRHAIFALDFDDDAHLTYVDRRKLGAIDLTDDPAVFTAAHRLGPDALDVDRDTFDALLTGRRGGIKSALMDQSLVAGLGNVYTDEVLFHAEIHPLAPVPGLNAKQRKRLYDVMRKVLSTAIAHDAERKHMPKDYLLPHRRDGATCPRCGGTIRQISVNGRSTYYCGQHQPEPA